MRCVKDATPCDGTPATLNEDEGRFGITEAQYLNNMKCGWLIHVSPSKVCNLIILS